jgi:hypothetical protein
MNESTTYAQKSRLAGASHRFGVLAIMLLLLVGFIVAQAVWEARTGIQVWQTEFIGIPRFADIFAIAAVLAAISAIIYGILGLVDIRRGAGKVKGRGLAVSGLVTGTLTFLTLLTPVVLFVLVPLIFAGDARKVKSANNLKELGLAMNIYHDYYGHFPPAVLHDPRLGERGQPYSWRVALLPILGENELYSQYRRDEPWDSPANKAVLDRMPRVFAAPGDARAADGFTHYQVLVGPGTAFERPNLRLRLGDFPRGAAQTILVVEAADPVPWTKPEDLPYTPDGPLPKVGGLVGNGFHAVFAEASVRWFEAKQQENALRTLVLLNDR